MPPLHFLIKPASSGCNMRCRYCFYCDEAAIRSIPSYGVMDRDTAEALIKAGFDAADTDITFAFQGGEPTLAGLPFFREFVELVRRHNKKSRPVHYAFQTNGILLDGDWMKFFRENRVLVGLSLDGPREIHDRYRMLTPEKGSFDRVMEAARLLQEQEVDFNTLTVVTAQAAKEIGAIYRFFRENGLTYQQYIPCLDPMEEKRGGQEYSLTPGKYAAFLQRLFDLWYNDVVHGRPIYIRYFENLLGMVLGQPPENCGMLGHCAIQYVFEADGGVYPCDFYVLDDYLLGNIRTDPIAAIDGKRREIRFLEDSLQVEAGCISCQWNLLCRGGCRRDRAVEGDGGLGRNYFCSAYRSFFAYAAPRLQRMAANISRNNGR